MRELAFFFFFSDFQKNFLIGYVAFRNQSAEKHVYLLICECTYM